MFGWIKRRRQPEQPSVRQQILGELQCHSPVVLLADPACMYDPVKIEDVPPGRHSVHATIIRYPEGGERIAKIAIRFRPGNASERRALGSIGVDSASVVALDEATFQEHWKEVGPERIGRTFLGNHRRIAKLIGDKFGLKWREVDFLHSEFAESIPEELEARIEEFLKTFPKYAKAPYMYFRIDTRNSLERVFEAMSQRLWSEVVLDVDSGAHLIAVSSGFGDGRYTVDGLYYSGELQAVEVEFIGPAQDKVLDAFPMLRY